MADLPTGTVTFLFTDIEGSTQHLTALGPAFGQVIERHHAILRARIRENHGVVIGTEGDAFFAVFTDATGALRAALDAQRELLAEAWPNGREVRVRMGLLTGQGTLGGDNYVGLDVPAALEAIRESAAIFADAGNALGVSLAVEGLATMSAWVGEPERAARLFGYADATKKRVGGTPPPMLVRTGPYRDLAIKAVGRDRFDRLMSEGALLQQAEAIALGDFQLPADMAPLPTFGSMDQGDGSASSN